MAKVSQHLNVIPPSDIGKKCALMFVTCSYCDFQFHEKNTINVFFCKKNLFIIFFREMLLIMPNKNRTSPFVTLW